MCNVILLYMYVLVVAQSCYIKCLYICYIVENYCIVLDYTFMTFMRGLHVYDRTGVVRDHAITALIYYS